MALNVKGVRIDPLVSYNFLITLVDSSDILSTTLSAIYNVALGGFSECSGLEATLNVEEYQEGGNHGSVLKFPTRVDWAPIRLKRGVTLSEDLWNWHFDFVEGKGKRRDGIIVLQSETHIPVKAWYFLRGLPTKWTGPSLNAMQSGLSFEEIEITHEGMRLISPGSGVEALGASF